MNNNPSSITKRQSPSTFLQPLKSPVSLASIALLTGVGVSVLPVLASSKLSPTPSEQLIAQKLKEVSGKFSKVNKLATVQTFGGWNSIQKKFFDDGAIFDQIQGTNR